VALTNGIEIAEATESPAVPTTLESRSPRLAQLDAQVPAEVERHRNRAGRRSKPRRRSTAPLPAAVRKEIARLARELNRQHAELFTGDPKLRDRIARLLRSLLPPKPRRRGRPGIDSVTKAIGLLGKLRKQYPDERAAKIWQRIYPEAIPNYAGMNPIDQEDARQVLRERVWWRLRDRKRRALTKRPGEIA
jgi:hypothetical protein